MEKPKRPRDYPNSKDYGTKSGVKNIHGDEIPNYPEDKFFEDCKKQRRDMEKYEEDMEKYRQYKMVVAIQRMKPEKVIQKYKIIKN